MFRNILISSFVLPCVSDQFSNIPFTFVFRTEVYFSAHFHFHTTLKQQKLPVLLQSQYN